MPNSQVKSLVLGGTTYDLVDETSTFSTIAGAHEVVTNATGSISIKIPTTAAHVGAAASDHTHTTTLATDTGTPSITLASAGKYKLTAGGTSVIFTMPTIPTVNYPVTSVNTKTGDITLSASDVGAAATSHAHGNITSGGDITATAPTIANGDQIVINDSSVSKITNGPTFDGSTTNKYLSPKGTWESLPQGTAYTAGTGLSLSGTEFNHSNSITATETVGVYPIEIDAQGHISYYGDAVNIDNFVENYNGENISGYIATVTSDGCGVLRYRDQRFSEDNTAQIQYGTASNNTSSFISLDANDINIWGNINAESNKIINLGTPTASTDAATKGYVDSNIPTKVSDLTNDSGFITDAGVTGAKGTEAISVTPPAETADGYSTGNITITHSTRAGYKHIPSGGSSGQILKYGGSSGTATWSTPSISATYDSTTKDLTLSIATS